MHGCVQVRKAVRMSMSIPLLINPCLERNVHSLASVDDRALSPERRCVHLPRSHHTHTPCSYRELGSLAVIPAHLTRACPYWCRPLMPGSVMLNAPTIMF